VVSAAVVSLEKEAALLDNQLVKLIAYADVNALTTRHEGAETSGFGVHPGVHAMLDVAGVRIEADLEGNVGGDGYAPRYFDKPPARAGDGHSVGHHAAARTLNDLSR